MSQSSPSQTFIRLLSASWASVITSMFISLVTVAITMYYTVYKGSALEEYGRQFALEQNDLRDQLNILVAAVNSSEFVANAYVFVLWIISGVVLYALAMAVFHIIRGSTYFVATLRFLPNDQKPQLLVQVIERLLLRLLGAAGLLAVYQLTLLGAVPIIYTLQKLKIQPEILSITVSVTVTILITMALMHLLTIVLRLLTLRVRLLH